MAKLSIVPVDTEASRIVTSGRSSFYVSGASIGRAVMSFLSPSAISAASTALSATDHTGGWVDSNSNGLPDAGEQVGYTVVVTNDGTVTLKNVEATSPTSGDVSCTDDLGETLLQPVAALGVGEWYKCTGSHSVRARRARVRESFLGLDRSTLSPRSKRSATA